MAVGSGETAHQALQVPYQNVPEKGVYQDPMKLDPVNYAPITQALQSGLDALMKSPLNPAVRADMQASVARSKEQMALLKSPDRSMEGISGGELTVVPGVQGGPGHFTKDPGMPVAPAAPVTQPGGGDGQAPAAPTKSDGSTPPPSDGTNPSGGFDSNTPVFRTSSGYDTNPETPSTASLFGKYGQPNAPDAPNGSTAQTQPQASPVQVAAAKQKQQDDLTNWQAVNASPPASAQAAKDWMGTQTTKVTHATYMSHGGPNQTPAYAFEIGSGKTATTNIVPLSQMVSHGFAPAVTDQNRSAAISAGDAANGGSPQELAQNAPAPGQPPPGAPDQPPGQMPQDQFSQQLASATNVQSTGGPGLDVLSAENRPGPTSNFRPTTTNSASNLPINTSVGAVQAPPADAVPGQANAAVNTANATAQKANWKDLPDGPNGSKLVQTMPSGVRWYSDPRTSGIPYLIYGSTPWSETRMYNDGKWEAHDYMVPEGVMNQKIADLSGQDASGWKTGDKISFLRSAYYDTTHGVVQPETANKLMSMRNQVLSTQRLQDGLAYLKDKDGNIDPGQWGQFRQLQQALAAHQYDWQGAPWDKVWQGLTQSISGGVDPRLQHVFQAYKDVMAGQKDQNLSGSERGELDKLGLDGNLPDTIKQVNTSRMAEYNRYLNTALQNNERVSKDFVNDANMISTKNRLKDGTTYAEPTPATGAGPQSTGAPPLRVPSDNSRSNPYMIDTANQADGMAIMKRLGHHVWVSDKHGNVMMTP